MTTELSAGAIPPIYREIYDISSINGELIHKDVYKCLLSTFNLNTATLNVIWDLTTNCDSCVTRTNLYKGLALVAWAQQGKSPSEKLFDNFTSAEYPTPLLSDLTSVKELKTQLSLRLNPATFGLTYSEIKQLDSVSVELLPEKKGIFIKYYEYVVSSKRFNSRVTRRYTDFVALYDSLLGCFPYRMIPRLPPKRIVSDATFLELRRRGLQRWLTLICRHPVICYDGIISFFLTDKGTDVAQRMREIYRRAPDEFMTSEISAYAKKLLPKNCTEFASSREQVRNLVHVVSRLKQITDNEVERRNSDARDSEEMANQLKNLSTMKGGHINSGNWNQMQKGFTYIAKELTTTSIKIHQHSAMEQITICERLALLLDILLAHRDLCDRLEKGLAHDHQLALSKMLTLKKRKIQGVIRGTDSESVEQLEARMLTQENIITNIELRSDFSLYCVHMETQLVHAYLDTLSPIIGSLITLRVRSNSELADIWRQVLPTAEKFFTFEGGAINGETSISK
ncbi:sorting nexin-8 [Agrilus planipennis]|uniref:Sorting nexin-8 n=1 Tax=Agrilus planipennis TaxID=224129 RepID=A0A1W4X8J3_AGRPL|nr:sorting nexin-8 [Agrilus planipennis]XP_018332345.1 sorting nexin-8 [Agrilus planipennis]